MERRSASLVATSALAAILACGSRTTFTLEEGPPPPPECVLDKDCAAYGDRCFPVRCVEGACKDLAPVDCDDKNPCTTDNCDGDTGMCSYAPAVLDLDGDQHPGPLPGKKPGDPDACGDDCDDTNAAARPGGSEVCDGVDNDCDGIVDNGASVSPAGDAVRVSDGAAQASPASIAYSAGRGYMAAFTGEVAGNAAVYLAALSRTGAHGPPARFTVGPADAYGGPLAWTGDRFGLAWSDRRDARNAGLNYEIYFNIVNPDGTKRNPDLRVTNASGFSISPALAWTGNEFIVVWQDDGVGAFGTNELFAQRIDVDGRLAGGNVKLADDGTSGQTAPAIAAGSRSIGVVWLRGGPQAPQLVFAAFDHQLRPMGRPAVISARMTSGAYPIIVRNQSEYVIAWHDQESALKTVYGAVRDELGNELVAAKPLTVTPGHARYPAILPYGDRALLVWSDDRDQNFGYELYGKTVSKRLDTLTSETRLTNAVGHSIDPSVAFGPNGEVGILFGDIRTGTKQAYFTHLECATVTRPPPR